MPRNSRQLETQCLHLRSGEAPERIFAVRADADGISEAEFGPVEVLQVSPAFVMRMKGDPLTGSSARGFARQHQGMLTRAAASSWFPRGGLHAVPRPVHGLPI